jgi:hypothetical protein
MTQKKQKGKRTPKGAIRIDHAKVIDGHRELIGNHYIGFDSHCRCDQPIHISADTQRYLLEEKQIPVKMLMRGAVLCEDCRRRRARMAVLRDLSTETAREELRKLEQEEDRIETTSNRKYERASWPYDK